MLAVLATSCDLALRHARLESTRAHVQLLRRPGRRDIKVEDINRQTNSCARVRNVHNARDVALDRRARQEEVDLIITVTEAA